MCAEIGAGRRPARVGQVASGPDADSHPGSAPGSRSVESAGLLPPGRSHSPRVHEVAPCSPPGVSHKIPWA